MDSKKERRDSSCYSPCYFPYYSCCHRIEREIDELQVALKNAYLEKHRLEQISILHTTRKEVHQQLLPPAYKKRKRRTIRVIYPQQINRK